MHWKVLQKFSFRSFKRATGVQKEVFLELVEIVTNFGTDLKCMLPFSMLKR